MEIHIIKSMTKSDKNWNSWASSGRWETSILAIQIENLTHVYRAINRLSKINWFKESVRDIRAFKVEDWSDFTEIVKNNLKAILTDSRIFFFANFMEGVRGILATDKTF